MRAGSHLTLLWGVDHEHVLRLGLSLREVQGS